MLINIKNVLILYSFIFIIYAVCLIIEGMNCIRRCRILCGESLSKMDFENIPIECLKRKYGTNEIMNGVVSIFKIGK